MIYRQSFLKNYIVTVKKHNMQMSAVIGMAFDIKVILTNAESSYIVGEKNP